MAVDQGATYSAAVPAIWQSARQELEQNLQEYKGRFKIQNIICGGSAPPPEMMGWYKKEFNVDFMQGWGMTETSPMGTFAKFITRYEHTKMTVENQFNNIKVAGLNTPGLEMRAFVVFVLFCLFFVFLCCFLFSFLGACAVDLSGLAAPLTLSHSSLSPPRHCGLRRFHQVTAERRCCRW